MSYCVGALVLPAPTAMSYTLITIASWTSHYGHRRRPAQLLCFPHVAPSPASTHQTPLGHKPTRDMWLKRHKTVHLHYTPTHASWLSQIEIWFSILTGQSLSGASFASLKDLIAHIDAFIERYNQTARPFVWTKSQVHQKRLRPCFADP